MCGACSVRCGAVRVRVAAGRRAATAACAVACAVRGVRVAKRIGPCPLSLPRPAPVPHRPRSAHSTHARWAGRPGAGRKGRLSFPPLNGKGFDGTGGEGESDVLSDVLVKSTHAHRHTCTLAPRRGRQHRYKGATRIPDSAIWAARLRPAALQYSPPPLPLQRFETGPQN